MSDDTLSYNTHSNQYMESSALLRETEIHKNNNISPILYKTDMPHGKMIGEKAKMDSIIVFRWKII